MTTDTIKVLIVDDDFDLPFLLENALNRKGRFEVQKATRGDVGFVKFKETKPHVVLTDYYMPGLSGGELLAKIVASEWPVPVIVMSGDEKVRSGEDLKPAFKVIHKPFLVADLVKAILSAVKHQESAGDKDKAKAG